MLASAIFFPALIADIVGIKPAQPTIPVTTVSALSHAATALIPSFPPKTKGASSKSKLLILSFKSSIRLSSSIATTSGLCVLTCSVNKLIFLPAERATALNLSGCSLAISRV